MNKFFQFAILALGGTFFVAELIDFTNYFMELLSHIVLSFQRTFPANAELVAPIVCAIAIIVILILFRTT